MTRIHQAIIFINNFSFGLIIPVMNLILLERGASLKSLPILMALYAVTVLCFELPSGICADLYGRKKVFLISCLTQLISMILLVFASDIIWLAFAILFNGLSRSFASGSLDALIIDHSLAAHGEAVLSKVTSRLAVLEGIGLAVGGIAGGFIAYAMGNQFNILLRGGFTALIFLLCIRYVKDLHDTEKEEWVSLPEHLKMGRDFVSSVPALKLLLAGVFFYGFFIISLETYWQPAFMNMNVQTDNTWLLGVITFASFMAAVSGNTLSQKLLHKFPAHQWKIYYISRIILSLGIVFLSLQMSSIGFLIGYISIYLLTGTGNVAENTIVNQCTPNKMRASILSVSSFLSQAGVMCSSIFSSIMVNRLQINGIWRVTGIMLGGYVLFVTVITYLGKRKHLINN